MSRHEDHVRLGHMLDHAIAADLATIGFPLGSTGNTRRKDG